MNMETQHETPHQTEHPAARHEEIIRKEVLEDQILDDAGNIMVTPRVTFSMDDPLNMPQWRKWLFLGLMCCWSGIGFSTQSFLSSVLPQVQEQYPTASVSAINLLFTINGPLIAPANIIIFISASTIGMRPTLLFTATVFVVSNILGAVTTSYVGLLICRILNGIATAPTDALQFTYIEKFTFLHERGLFLGVLNSSAAALQLFLNIASSYIVASIGLRWAFVLYSILSGLCLIALWILMPELNFRREPQSLAPPMTLSVYRSWRKRLGSRQLRDEILMSPFSKVANVSLGEMKDSLLLLMTAASNPMIWWLGACQTVFFGGFSAMATYYAAMLQSKPWSWPAGNVSLLNLTGFFIAPLLVFAGWISDRISLELAKRRGGIARPEDRLCIMVLPVVTCFTGFIGFGFLAEHYFDVQNTTQPHWFTLVVVYTLAIMGMVGGIEVTSVYLYGSVDVSESLAAMTICCCIRDLASFGLNHGIVSFVDRAGYAASFGTYGGLSILLGGVAVPIYLHGPNIRYWLRRSG
ncbi:hypothetical protein PEBR_32124 [Penicillium brasilianum]|uniref:Major facilitator superfamily (MFS) profile domain-containing protein n=1 Tax=Penicillium brasilianum TaxID=104259 RepID=A0A1S9REY7_PENBI|nr:hypothetical protein PEBR_32124 [Penicillium brasilianum]